MKNTLKIVVLLVFIFASTQSFAQIKFGVKAGMNLNDVAFDLKDLDNEAFTKIRLGYVVGGIVDYKINDNISIQSGINYSSKGTSVDIDKAHEVTNSKGYIRLHFNYLEIPIQANYKFDFGLEVFAGGYLSFGINGKDDFDFEYTYDDGTKIENKGVYKYRFFLGELSHEDYMEINTPPLSSMRVPYNMLDYGLNLGVGYKVWHILFNAQYSFGLGNLQVSSMEIYDSYDPKNPKMSNL